MSTAVTLDPTTEADFLRRQIKEAQAKLDQLSIENQHERNLAQQRREYEAAKRFVSDARQRHAAVAEQAVKHLDELKVAIADAHLYQTFTDIGGTKTRQHVSPGNPQIDPAKRGVLEQHAMKFLQSLIGEYQMFERASYAEAKFVALRRAAYANVDEALVEIQEGLVVPVVEVEQTASVSANESLVSA